MQSKRQSCSEVNYKVREECRILLGCRPRIGLNIDTPYGGIKVEGLERPLATEDLELVNPFVATVITCVG